MTEGFPDADKSDFGDSALELIEKSVMAIKTTSPNPPPADSP